MGVLVIRCPNTRRTVSTGIEISPEDLAILPNTLSNLKCPECGLDHAWWTSEAWLEERTEITPPKNRFKVR